MGGCAGHLAKAHGERQAGSVRIALGSDHRGFDLKQDLLSALKTQGHDCEDFGAHSTDSMDYPDIAAPLAQAVARGEYDLGILVCGTGIGMSVTANKVPGVRAALCHDVFTAQRAHQHTNANVLCLGAEQLDGPKAKEIVNAYLETHFEGGRHQKRLDKVARLEKGPPSVAEAKARYVTRSPAAEDSADHAAPQIAGETARQRAGRQAEARRRMSAFIEQIEREVAASGVEGPTDASEHLDQYIY